MRIYEFEEIDNTNKFLKEKDDILERDLVIAKNQTNGRGRLGKPWISSEGSAIYSFVLTHCTSIQDSEYSKLPLLVGYSLLKSLKKIEYLDFKFKWTNDIYINDKKISGILVEKIEDNYIIGIGVNINNVVSEELKDKAVSLREITGKKYDIKPLIIKFVEDFFEIFKDFKNDKWDEILQEINSVSYLFGKRIDVVNFDKIESGIAGDILSDGMLEVFINGEIKKYNVGDIHIPQNKVVYI